ncbi:MAG: gamma-glutamyltransferase family protein [Phycisphaeraceae bacterium]|nr:gamma-glutamyltransferase family protein [Phycisphaeraceae bacterium]MCW5762748.1 gamma-glutamyltransferase family protein [Phycisphaeraceae bacterium]
MDMDYTYHYPSQRAPVMARNIVTTSHPLAAQAGLSMLDKGGTAADAAVATAMALTVLEPTSNGIGSDAFALVWAGGGLHGLSANGRAPAGLDRSRYAASGDIPTLGWDGVIVPGAVSGWVALAREFGRLPLTTLAEPAIRYAREGSLVPPEIAYYWNRAADIYGRARRQHEALLAPWFETFTSGGKAPRVGSVARLPDHATTLEAIAATDGQAFYRGDLAEKIDAAARAGGSSLRSSDLAAHQPDWVRPISINYKGWKLHEIPPSGQGIAALMALGIVRLFDLAMLDPDSPNALHIVIEAMKLAFADAHQHIADPDFMQVRPADLLDETYLASRARLIDPNRAQDFGHGEPKTGGTVLLAAADAEGMMVSFIQSNYTGFGSGVVVPGTGIALHNRGCNFSLEAGHVNEVGPGKRPYHTIIPGFVTRTRADGSDEPLMAFGVMGGFMQPQGHVQVLLRMADHRMNPQSALDAPRWQVEKGLRVTIEPGFDAGVYEGLRALGHDLHIHDKPNAAFGRGQSIVRVDGGYIAGCDPRCDGQAVGF